MSHDQRVAGIRSEQTGEHADQGRLPGAVGAKQTEDLAPEDIKRDSVDCPVLSKAAVQVLYLDSQCVSHEELPVVVVF